jgi:hypothetical protein
MKILWGHSKEVCHHSERILFLYAVFGHGQLARARSTGAVPEVYAGACTSWKEGLRGHQAWRTTQFFSE